MDCHAEIGKNIPNADSKHPKPAIHKQIFNARIRISLYYQLLDSLHDLKWEIPAWFNPGWQPQSLP